MAYDVTLVQVNASSFGFSKSNFVGFGNFDTMLFSMWCCLPPPSSDGGPAYTSSFFSLTARGTSTDLILYSSSFAGIGIQMFNGTFGTALSGVRSNVLLSVQASTQTVQLYINDAPASPTAGGWTALNSFHVNAINRFGFNVGGGGGFFPAFADIWCNAGGAFVDLSITANRRKFINADLSPVDPGSNGQTPFGSAPIIFQTVPAAGVANAFLVNRGTGSSPFVLDLTNTLSLQAPGVCTLPNPPAPESHPVDLADLWFGATTGFVDPAVTANRRLFVGADDSTQNLGTDGSTPFGVAPAVFLTRATDTSPADTWAANAGVGGAFSVLNGDLTIAATRPPCSTITPPTPPPTDMARFDAPQMMLDYSKDGGLTWAPLQMFRSMGQVGEYIKRLRWLNLGVSRTWVFRIQCTDPVRRYIIGAYIDDYRGLG